MSVSYQDVASYQLFSVALFFYWVDACPKVSRMVCRVGFVDDVEVVQTVSIYARFTVQMVMCM